MKNTAHIDQISIPVWLKFLPDNSAMQIIIAANVADTFRRRWNIVVSQHEQNESRNFSNLICMNEVEQSV
jgi:hypothetical protein